MVRSASDGRLFRVLGVSGLVSLRSEGRAPRVLVLAASSCWFSNGDVEKTSDGRLVKVSFRLNRRSSASGSFVSLSGSSCNGWVPIIMLVRRDGVTVLREGVTGGCNCMGVEVEARELFPVRS